MRDIIVKAKLDYFISFFGLLKARFPYNFLVEGNSFSVSFIHQEPLDNPLFERSGHFIELGGFSFDPEDEYGEHEEEYRTFGYIEIRPLADERLMLVFHQEEPEFENVITWVVNEIGNTYSIESQTSDNSEDFIPQIPGNNESLFEGTNLNELQTKNTASIFIEGKQIPDEGSKLPGSKIYVPTVTKYLERWKKAYIVIEDTKDFYFEQYHESEIDRSTVSIDEYRDALNNEIQWKPSSKTVERIIKAGEAGLLK